MVMKRKMGLELYGPCSVTGAEPTRWSTIATINEFNRVTFHTAQIISREAAGAFVVTTTDGVTFLSSDCYLLYTAPSVSKLKNVVRRVKSLLS